MLDQSNIHLDQHHNTHSGQPDASRSHIKKVWRPKPYSVIVSHNCYSGGYWFLSWKLHLVILANSHWWTYSLWLCLKLTIPLAVVISCGSEFHKLIIHWIKMYLLSFVQNWLPVSFMELTFSLSFLLWLQSLPNTYLHRMSVAIFSPTHTIKWNLFSELFIIYLILSGLNNLVSYAK